MESFAMRDGNMLKYVIESFATRDGTRFPDFPDDFERYPTQILDCPQ